jgi:hypothetical protein
MPSLRSGRALGAVLVLAVFLPTAAVAQNLSSAQKTLTDAQLRLLFDKYDLNKDGYLDADELARAFRGRNAKPMPHFALHDLKGKTYPITQDLRRYPDEIFLRATDTDFDGRVSWPEYKAYGEAYATVLRQEVGFERALQAAYLRALQNQANAMYRRANYVRQQYVSRYRAAQRYYRRPSYRGRPRRYVRRYTPRRRYVPRRYTPRRVAYRPPVRRVVRTYRPPVRRVVRRPPVRRVVRHYRPPPRRVVHRPPVRRPVRHVNRRPPPRRRR